MDDEAIATELRLDVMMKTKYKVTKKDKDYLVLNVLCYDCRWMTRTYM
jgi:hypothetical protein